MAPTSRRAAGAFAVSTNTRLVALSLLVHANACLAIIELPTPPVYKGPSVAQLKNCIASVPLDGSGLVLEVADSLVANGGKGLFIRCEEGVPSVTVARATPLCGYADGCMQKVADEAGGKTVAFALRSAGTAIFFEGEMRTVGDVLQDTSVSTIAGHDLTCTSSGELASIEVDESYKGVRFFVPSDPQPEPSIMILGQFANDLAVGGAEGGDYSSESAKANLLCLVQRLERDPTDATKLVPSRPISTLAQDITFENSEPMEVGCQYGERYWFGSGSPGSE